MTPFAYVRADSLAGAIGAAQRQPGARFVGGGTNLVDLMREGIEQPATLVDLTRVGLDAIEPHGPGLRLGALARNADTANHPLVRERYPLVAQAILAGASSQLRNVATNGGNLRQRTRCPYFYEVHAPCNKRRPGAGCAALGGHNRTHAILGAGDACVATYPGDMAQALHALDAVVQLQGPAGRRSVAVSAFHRLPGDRPDLDADIGAAEAITAIDLPADAVRFAPRSVYLKVRDRASYAFALVSLAAAVEMDGPRIREARLCLGGVAHKPWRAREAEAALAGREPTPATVEAAAGAALAAARPLEHNRYKVTLAKALIVRAVTDLAGKAA